MPVCWPSLRNGLWWHLALRMCRCQLANLLYLNVGFAIHQANFTCCLSVCEWLVIKLNKSVYCCNADIHHCTTCIHWRTIVFNIRPHCSWLATTMTEWCHFIRSNSSLNCNTRLVPTIRSRSQDFHCSFSITVSNRFFFCHTGNIK